jgi:hypothetical protein
LPIRIIYYRNLILFFLFAKTLSEMQKEEKFVSAIKLFLWIGIGMCPTVSVSAIVPSLHGAWK